MKYAQESWMLLALLRGPEWSLDGVAETPNPEKWISFNRVNAEARRRVSEIESERNVTYSLRQLSFAVTMLEAEAAGQLDAGLLNVLEEWKQL